MEVVEDDGAWVASVPDLPGCNSFGSTLTEAIDNLQRTKTLWIEGQYKSGNQIPEPTVEEDFSGKFLLRIPKILHRSLSYEARNQGVSLNHYVSHLLTQRQSLCGLETFVNSLVGTRLSCWRTSFVSSQDESVKALVGGRLDFLACLRLPPAKYEYTISTPASVRKLYQPK